MARLEAALENPMEPSFPKRLRRLMQNDIHSRVGKVLREPELQNWADSVYPYSTIIWDKCKVMSTKEGETSTTENFVAKIKHYLLNKKGEK